jgi:CMP-N,N'-diacetyllegionaminic acid synthase
VNILITICARGGSKGIPKKNIKNINGIPLIEYSIRLANKYNEKWNAKVALSTDDIEIKRVAEILGLTTNYIRPDYLATDTAGKIDSINDLILYEETLINCKYDFILDLDVTSPLRNLVDLENSFQDILNSKAISLFSVNAASRNPYFNMVEEKPNGFFNLVKVNTDGTFMTRQSAPKVFELNASFYWYRRCFFDNDYKSPITNESLIYLVPHICFDLDHLIDFYFMEFLIENEKLDFNL